MRGREGQGWREGGEREGGREGQGWREECIKTLISVGITKRLHQYHQRPLH